MVDLEPLLESPFEQASNRQFEAVLAVGVLLLAAVAAFGRSPVTMLLVGLYLLAIPAFVAVRVWVWESPVLPDPAETDGRGSEDEASGDGKSADEESAD